MARILRSWLLVSCVAGSLVLLWIVSASVPPGVDAARAATTIVVTSASDGGAGSLRQALLDAQTGDTITFDATVFPPGSPVTIALTSALPQIVVDDLTLDGTGAGVVLDGSGTPVTTTGLVVNGAHGVTIKGLRILFFPTDGVEVGGGASDVVIGGINVSAWSGCSGDCNLISGNDRNGIWIHGEETHAITVTGNAIGTDMSGSTGLGNGVTRQAWGVKVESGPVATWIGGPGAGEGNLISGNGDLFCGPPSSAKAYGGGVMVGSGTLNTVVQGNRIGTDAAGMNPIPNAIAGIEADTGASGVMIGGLDPGEGNLVSANGCDGPPPPRGGIRLFASHALIQGNVIGPDVTGEGIFPWPNQNGYSGVLIFGSDNVIASNILAGNGGTGIQILSSSAVRNTFTANAIYSNTHKGIALNDGNGAVSMFPPLFTEVSETDVKGIAVPGSTVAIHSDAGDEGRWYQGETMADAGGYFTFTAELPFTGTYVTGLATDAAGNTSEFGSPFAPRLDVGVTAVYVPQLRHQVGVAITPTVQVANGGTTPMTLTVTAVITHDGARVYEETMLVSEVGALQYHTVSFPAWTPASPGAHTFAATVTTAAPDDDPANDVQPVALVVVDARSDLWARDNELETGGEPSTGPGWQSPDLWVRNAEDGLTIPQDPINTLTNTVYMTVRNRGTLTATDATVTVYWHPPALVIGQSWWTALKTVSVGAVGPGEAKTVSFAWRPQVAGVEEVPYHTCLIGVISATLDLPPLVWDVPGSNNLAQRNVDIIQQAASDGLAALAAGGVATTTFALGNPYAVAQLVDVIVNAEGLTNTATLALDLGTLFARWQVVGQNSVAGGTLDGTRVLVAGGGEAVLRGIPLTAAELVTVVASLTGLPGEAGQVDISERIGGDVLGGVTLALRAPERYVYLPLVLRGQ